jgi:hypothetical protein
MNPALQAALKTIVAEITKADAAGLKAGPGAMKIEVEAEGEPGEVACLECAAGTCADPEHMSDEDMSAMAEGY